jgi:hypothetical protein
MGKRQFCWEPSEDSCGFVNPRRLAWTKKLEEKVLLRERRSATRAKRGKRFSSSSENGLFKHLMAEYTTT